MFVAIVVVVILTFLAPPIADVFSTVVAGI
jgi:hypothetical protein